MFPYLVILTLFLFLSIVETGIRKKVYKKILHFFLLLSLIVFISATTSRGDYSSYIDIFNKINLDNITPTVETTYYYLLAGIKFLELDANYLFIISSTIAILIKFKALSIINNKINYSFFFLIYISLFSIYLELGSIRFAIATSFLFLSTIFLNTNLKKYYLYVIIGSLFHTSLLVALIIPFSLKRSPLFIFLSLLITGIFTTFLLNDPLTVSFLSKNYYISKALNYSRYGPISLNFQLIKQFAILTLFYFCYKKEIKDRQNYIYTCWMLSIWGVGLYFFFNQNSLVASRYLLMFSVIDPIIIIMCLSKITPVSRYAIATPILIITLYINLGLTIHNNNNIINIYIPYKNYIWSEPQKYEDPVKLKQILEHS